MRCCSSAMKASVAAFRAEGHLESAFDLSPGDLGLTAQFIWHDFFVPTQSRPQRNRVRTRLD